MPLICATLATHFFVQVKPIHMGSFLVNCGASGHSLQEGTPIQLAFLHEPVMSLKAPSKSLLMGSTQLQYENLLIPSVVKDSGGVALDDSGKEDALRLMKILHNSQLGYKVEEPGHSINKWSKYIDERCKSLDELDGLTLESLSKHFSILLHYIRQGQVFYIHPVQKAVVRLYVSYVDNAVFQIAKRTPFSVCSDLRQNDGALSGRCRVQNFNEFMAFAALSSYERAMEESKSSPDPDLFSPLHAFNRFITSRFAIEPPSHYLLFWQHSFPDLYIKEKKALDEHIADYFQKNKARIFLQQLSLLGLDLTPSRYVGQDYGDSRGQYLRTLMRQVGNQQHFRLLVNHWENDEFQEEPLEVFMAQHLEPSAPCQPSFPSAIPNHYADSAVLSYFNRCFIH